MTEPMAAGPTNLKTETLRGRAGFFRVGQTASGAWWMFDAAGDPFVLRAVNEVRRGPEADADPSGILKTWGFNALGAASEISLRDDGLPFVATVRFADAGAVIRLGGVRLPDVYDPAWPQAAAFRAAEVCFPSADNRALVGWLADDDLGWGQPSTENRPSLLQVCLSLEPAASAYHAAWEFVLALHGGKLAAVGRAWSVPLTNKEVIREMTRTDRAVTSRGYLRDEARWTQEFARRYFTLTSAAIRAHDPHHLVLGCRFAGRASPAILAECRYPSVDVPWIDVDDLPLAESGPAIAGEFNWTDPRFLGAPGARRARGLTSVERMLRRGRAALERCARHPALVGYSWSRWRASTRSCLST